MREMLERFRQYVEKKKLMLNMRKSMMMMMKIRGRQKIWRWESEKIETMKEWKYLGMYVSNSNSKEGHIQ